MYALQNDTRKSQYLITGRQPQVLVRLEGITPIIDNHDDAVDTRCCQLKGKTPIRGTMSVE